MTASGPKSLPAIGFLTVVQDAQLGSLGGYLVLNTAGRPLEFHCTAPVKPNRAQQILYGPTLSSFLYGEQIGQTLLKKSRSKPIVVWTDVEAILAVREFCESPVVLVTQGQQHASHTDETRSDPASGGHVVKPPTTDSSGKLSEFALGNYHLAVAAAAGGDGQRVIDLWQPYADEFDLLEPFERIREAISEAQKGAA